MATEMCASRFIAPWFGTSMIVWAVIISVIMAALSAGYWLGGRLADRRPSWSLLYSIPLAAGVFTSLIPLAGRLVFERLTAGILATPVNIIVASFGGIVAVFVPPVLLLAMISPFVIRLLSTGTNTGRIAGSLYATSTLGSIAGTVVPAFLTIPLLGTRATLLLSSSLLVLLGAAGLRRRAPAAVLALALPAAVWFLTAGPVKPVGGVLHEEESLYQYLQVVEKRDGSICLVINEGGGIQSIVRPGDELDPDDTYYESYLMLPFMVADSGHPDVLVVGSAAGTIPRWLARYVHPCIPGLTTVAVDIDPRTIELGFDWFGTERDDAEFVVSDGRLFVEQSREPFDVIIIDTYSNQIYIPFHLTTLEYFTAISDRLAPGGIVAMNINATSLDSPLLQGIARTLGAVFENVRYIKFRGDYNYMLMASHGEIAAPSPDMIREAAPLLAPTAELFMSRLVAFEITPGPLLTDDRAPVEFMTDMMIAAEAGLL
jgi:spermidine synthase